MKGNIHSMSTRSKSNSRHLNRMTTRFIIIRSDNNGVEAERNRGKVQLPPPAAKRAKSKKTKTGHQSTRFAWSIEDEINFVNLLLSCPGEGGQVDMTAFYEKAKDTFGQNNTDKVKLYDKMRTMRSRFWKITSKLEEGNISENEFVFKSPHEAAMFKIWRQIWGSVEKHQNDGNPLPSQNEKHQNDGNPLPSQNDENPLPSQNDGNPLPSQNDGNRFINTIHPVNPEIDLCSRRIKELIEAVRSVKEFPGLGVAEAQLLQQKWRKHRMEELKLFSNSLALLQEECTLSLRELQHDSPCENYNMGILVGLESGRGNLGR